MSKYCIDCGVDIEVKKRPWNHNRCEDCWCKKWDKMIDDIFGISTKERNVTHDIPKTRHRKHAMGSTTQKRGQTGMLVWGRE